MRRRVAAARRLHGVRTGHARTAAAGDPEPGAPARPSPGPAGATSARHPGVLRARATGPPHAGTPHPDADARPPAGRRLRLPPSGADTGSAAPARRCPGPGRRSSGSRTIATRPGGRRARSWGAPRDPRGAVLDGEPGRAAAGPGPPPGADSHDHDAVVAALDDALGARPGAVAGAALGLLSGSSRGARRSGAPAATEREQRPRWRGLHADAAPAHPPGHPFPAARRPHRALPGPAHGPGAGRSCCLARRPASACPNLARDRSHPRVRPRDGGGPTPRRLASVDATVHGATASGEGAELPVGPGDPADPPLSRGAPARLLRRPGHGRRSARADVPFRRGASTGRVRACDQQRDRSTHHDTAASPGTRNGRLGRIGLRPPDPHGTRADRCADHARDARPHPAHVDAGAGRSSIRAAESAELSVDARRGPADTPLPRGALPVGPSGDDRLGTGELPA